MAQLISWLALAGARTSAGAPVSSGKCWFYQPGGGTTSATVYSDVDGSVVAANPALLDAAGRATIYVTAPVRIVIQDATGANVTDVDQADVTRAETVQIDNTGWSDTYLQDALSKLYTSTGGVDGQYLESGGATVRTIKAKFAELSISVKDFGAKGDGLTVDTTAIQAAINRMAFLGGGEVYFPPGTYLIDQTLTNTVSGVSLRGAGRGVSVVKLNSSTLDGITFTGCTGFSIRDLEIKASAASSGTGLVLATCTKFAVAGVYIHLFYVSCSSASGQNMAVRDCELLSPSAAGSSGRSLKLTDTTLATVTSSRLDAFGASSRNLELLGSTGALNVTGCWASATGTFCRFDSALTGIGFRFVGNYVSIGTANFSFAGAAMPAGFFQAGNGIDGYKGGLLSGATFTPDLTLGNNIVVDATTTGSAYTIAVPTPPPAATDYGVYFDMTLYCHAGAGITGWGLAAGYHASSAPSTTDTHRTHYRWWWDPDNSVWRDTARTDTT